MWSEQVATWTALKSLHMKLFASLATVPFPTESLGAGSAVAFPSSQDF